MKLHQPRNFQSLIVLGFVLLVAGRVVSSAQVPTPSPQSSPVTVQPPVQSPAQPTLQPVRLNVIVTGKSDQFIADMRQEDFRVEEDGVPQAIMHFAKEDSPASYALVVDNSGSLRSLINYIIGAAGSLIEANGPEDETMLVRFVSADNISVMQDFTADQAALIKRLDSMHVEGGQTAVIDAVYLSAVRVAERRAGESGSRRRALVLLTDGEDRSSYYKLSELQTLLRKSDVQVFAIGLLQNLDEQQGFIRKSPKENAIKLLNTLALETGGRAFYPKNVPDLKEALTEISKYLRTQYVIGYQPANASRDGKFRKVKIKLNESPSGAKRTVHTRSGYFAPDAKGVGQTPAKEKSPRLKSQ